MSRGPLPLVAAAAMMGVAMVAKEEEFAVMLVVQYAAYLRPSELCTLTAGHVIRPLQGSGASSWALLFAPQEEFKVSKTAERALCGTVIFLSHSAKALTRYTAGKTAATPLWSRSQARYAVDFAKLAETSGVNVILRCALENPIVGGKSKTRQMAQREKRQEVRKARSVAQGNLEAVRRHAKVWTTGGKSHVAATQWRLATSSARVDKTCSQPRMISETRCRAKLHGIFKNSQRQSRDGRFFLLLIESGDAK